MYILYTNRKKRKHIARRRKRPIVQLPVSLYTCSRLINIIFDTTYQHKRNNNTSIKNLKDGSSILSECLHTKNVHKIKKPTILT